MTLSPEQKAAVGTWIKAGASIADVQKRLREEFNVSLTYIDTRFLIDDLGLNLEAAPARKPADVPAVAPAGAADATAGNANAELVDEDAGFDDTADDFGDAGAAPAGAGTVKVEVDRITRPGTVVSGTVTFSDGQSGRWGLDQLGRLVFEGATPGYRPSPGDLQAFQQELSLQLQRHGY